MTDQCTNYGGRTKPKPESQLPVWYSGRAWDNLRFDIKHILCCYCKEIGPSPASLGSHVLLLFCFFSEYIFILWRTFRLDPISMKGDFKVYFPRIFLSDSFSLLGEGIFAQKCWQFCLVKSLLPPEDPKLLGSFYFWYLIFVMTYLLAQGKINGLYGYLLYINDYNFIFLWSFYTSWKAFDNNVFPSYWEKCILFILDFYL